MKSDEQIAVTIAAGHAHEAAFAAYLRECGLRVEALSRGFRSTHAQIRDYAHDVDLDVEGYRCQYKHRHSKLAVFASRGIRPFVDEVVKADRTPVDFYILRFGDGTIVVPYAPFEWTIEQRWDGSERAFKAFYSVEVSSGVPLETWIASFSSEICP